MGHAPPRPSRRAPSPPGRKARVVLYPAPSLTPEEVNLSYLRDEYARGSIDVESFEGLVERVLRGEWVMPMGGMPPPDTGRREMR